MNTKGQGIYNACKGILEMEPQRHLVGIKINVDLGAESL